jgi:sortase A
MTPKLKNIKNRKTVGYFFVLLGSIIIFVFLFSYFSYFIYSNSKLSRLVETDTTVYTGQDYRLISSWLGDKAKAYNFGKDLPPTLTYEITIPKLGINNAKVMKNHEDLSLSLVHFPQTADPGEPGNTVIFGHSVLPIFFNPDNYLTIFSTLFKLDKGDKIYVRHAGKLFEYGVSDMFEVGPDDIQILEQNSSGSVLTLVTCAPPGHPAKPKRLIVRAIIT